MGVRTVDVLLLGMRGERSRRSHVWLSTYRRLSGIKENRHAEGDVELEVNLFLHLLMIERIKSIISESSFADVMGASAFGDQNKQKRA
jgi:hypothetical protein